jgi:hypothetical protein
MCGREIAMDIQIDPNLNFTTLFENALVKNNAHPNDVTIVLHNGESLQIFADFTIGPNLIVFRPNSADQKLVAIPYNWISKIKF